nr:glycosyl hydrolase 53 family protein [Streptococcus vicugnae]
MTCAAVIGMSLVGNSLAKADDFINGADISILDEMEQSRAIYKINGKQQDPLTILKDNGVNYVRLRFWVDPGKQNLPKAWQNQSFEQLNSTVYSYTADVLNQMKAKGIYPDMVQIGNV